MLVTPANLMRQLFAGQMCHCGLSIQRQISLWPSVGRCLAFAFFLILSVANAFAAPTVSAVSPSSGPLTGGNRAAITGTNFVSGATVTIGGNTCINPSVSSSTLIYCNIPAGLEGTASVLVTTTGGTNADNGKWRHYFDGFNWQYCRVRNSHANTCY